jgi:hypothetical protein
MANTPPTKPNSHHILRDALLTIFAPGRLNDGGAIVVRNAFWWSLVLVLISSAVGYTFGRALVWCCGPVGASVVSCLQFSGAMLLLWGTLFVRGWEIQTWSGGTRTERVNQFIYRFLYCVGTGIIVCSLVL